MNPVSRLFVHEIRLVLREPRFWIPFLLPPIFLILMQVTVLSQFSGAASAFEPGMLLIIGALLATMTVTLTADSFAGERERNTLELLLCLPITLKQLFWGKLLALLPLPLILAILAQGLLWGLSSSMQSPVFLLQAILYAISVCLSITGVALLVSLFAHTVRSAAQSNVIFVLGILLGTQAISTQYFQSGIIPWIILPCSLCLFVLLVVVSLRRFERMN